MNESGYVAYSFKVDTSKQKKYRVAKLRHLLYFGRYPSSVIHILVTYRKKINLRLKTQKMLLFVLSVDRALNSDYIDTKFMPLWLAKLCEIEDQFLRLNQSRRLFKPRFLRAIPTKTCQL